MPVEPSGVIRGGDPHPILLTALQRAAAATPIRRMIRIAVTQVQPQRPIIRKHTPSLTEHGCQTLHIFAGRVLTPNLPVTATIDPQTVIRG